MKPFSLILVFLCLSAQAVSAREIHVQISEGLESVTVTASAGMGPLEAHNGGLLDRLSILENGKIRRGRLVAENVDQPVRYRVRLSHSSTQWAIAQWHGSLRLSDWNDWLLTPEAWTITQPFELFVSVEGGRAVLPFQFVERLKDSDHYRAYPLLPGHGGMSMFGEIQIRQINFGASGMTVSIVGEKNGLTEELFTWVDDVAKTVMRVHGGAPGSSSHVMIVPVPFMSGVVPWAHVRRGGGSHVIAYANNSASGETLYEDWTLYHELTHLYHPYLRSSGRWLSEGFASYYQNVYRARFGVVTPEYGYSRLRAGMKRGKDENKRDGYRVVTEGGRMRTYWTSAAMALEADTQIRELTSGEQTLASVIGEFARRELPAARTWHPRDYVQALDRLLPDPVLTPLYDEVVKDRYFPDVSPREPEWRQIFYQDPP